MNGKNIFAVYCLAATYFLTAPVSAAENCSSPNGLSLALSNERTKFLVFGEVHGSKETPALFGESVCAVAASGKKVLVGLEFPEAGATSFQQFLDSSGGPEDVKEFLSDTNWIQQASEFPDGRTSQAMLELVQRLRQLRASGYELSIAPFVRPVQAGSGSQTPYEQGLAASLIDAESNGTYDLVMILVGNRHAYKAVVNASPPFEPMAMHLPQDATITLSMVSEGGTAWNCRPECGIHPIPASSNGAGSGITLGREIAAGYDGIFNVGSASASPPVLELP